MRKIKTDKIQAAVKQATLDAAFVLRADVSSALKRARNAESAGRARRTIDTIITNADLAKKNKIPICQDTGMTVVICEIGRDVSIVGDIDKALTAGVKEATREGCLRRSVVACPVERKNTNTNTPIITHYRFVSGDKVKLSVLLKGFGCENKSKAIMLNPTASEDDIVRTVVDAIAQAGSQACPPYIVGVGIGGTIDVACHIAKEVLFEKVGVSRKKKAALLRLEKKIKVCANKNGIGALGFGGKTTVLDVLVKTAPTHIAGLPVAVNISCHALRTKTVSV